MALTHLETEPLTLKNKRTLKLNESICVNWALCFFAAPYKSSGMLSSSSNKDSINNENMKYEWANITNGGNALIKPTTRYSRRQFLNTNS